MVCEAEKNLYTKRSFRLQFCYYFGWKQFYSWWKRQVDTFEISQKNAFLFEGNKSLFGWMNSIVDGTMLLIQNICYWEIVLNGSKYYKRIWKQILVCGRCSMSYIMLPWSTKLCYAQAAKFPVSRKNKVEYKQVHEAYKIVYEATKIIVNQIKFTHKT